MKTKQEILQRHFKPSAKKRTERVSDSLRGLDRVFGDLDRVLLQLHELSQVKFGEPIDDIGPKVNLLDRVIERIQSVKGDIQRSKGQSQETVAQDKNMGPIESAVATAPREANHGAIPNPANEQTPIAAARPMEKPAMPTQAQAVDVEEQARPGTQFQQDARAIDEFERSKDSNVELTRRAVAAVNDVSQIMREQVDLLNRLATLPASIAELRAAQAQLAGQLSNHGP